MSIKFKLGTAVRQIVPVITGTVTDLAIVDGAVNYRVDSVDAAGVESSRFFAEHQIEAVAPAAE
jgi:hypothetical protein